MLTSEGVVQVPSIGYEGEITYEIKNSVEGVALEAQPDVEWLSIFSTAQEGKVLFAAEVNTTAESRTGIITLTYGAAEAYVRITQNAYGKDLPELVITSDTEMSVDRNNQIVDIYYNITMPTLNGYIYAFTDVDWAAVSDTSVEGIISVSLRPNYGAESRTATITVGYEHVRHDVTIVQSVEGERLFTASMLHGVYYGEQFSPGLGNYWFFFTDEGFDEMGRYKPCGTYYRIDAYGPLATVENGTVRIPEGRYTLDTSNSKAEWTFTAEYATFMATDDKANTLIEKQPTAGTLIVESDRISIEWAIDGESHTAIYYGEPVIPDESATQIVYSTLTDDYTLTLDDHYMLYCCYGDYYEYGYQNWMFVIKPNDNEGDCLQFDVIAHPSYDEGIVAHYVGSDYLAPQSFIPGWLSGSFEGSWYFTVDQTQVAPFRKGDVVVTRSDDGIFTVDVDVTDDLGHRIAATWSGVGEEVQPDASSLVLLSAAAPRVAGLSHSSKR